MASYVRLERQVPLAKLGIRARRRVRVGEDEGVELVGLGLPIHLRLLVDLHTGTHYLETRKKVSTV